MSIIVTYDSTDPLLANRVKDFNSSANVPDYDGVTEKLIDPDLSSLWIYGTGFTVPLQYWKYDGVSAIVEMSQAEKDIVDVNLNPFHIFLDGYHVTRKNYQTLADIQKYYTQGDHTTEISFTVCGSKNHRTGIAKITIGSDVKEYEIYLNQKHLLVPFMLKKRQNFPSNGNVNIKVEVKSSHGVNLTIHDIIVEVR